MTQKVHVLLESDPPDLASEARRIHTEIARALGAAALTGEYAPPLDVFETDHTLEVLVDLPGVDASALRIVARGHALLIAGIKIPRRPRGEASFHLVERAFGRFSRTVVFHQPCDMSRASARLGGGEVRISIPRLADRRGELIDIPLSSGSSVA